MSSSAVLGLSPPPPPPPTPHPPGPLPPDNYPKSITPQTTTPGQLPPGCLLLVASNVKEDELRLLATKSLSCLYPSQNGSYVCLSRFPF